VAEASPRVPKLVQWAPPSVENCQVPWALSHAVTAIPAGGTPSASEYRPGVATRASTAVPGLEAAGTSSLIAARVVLTLGSSTGAWLAAAAPRKRKTSEKRL